MDAASSDKTQRSWPYGHIDHKFISTAVFSLDYPFICIDMEGFCKLTIIILLLSLKFILILLIPAKVVLMFISAFHHMNKY